MEYIDTDVVAVLIIEEEFIVAMTEENYRDRETTDRKYNNSLRRKPSLIKLSAASVLHARMKTSILIRYMGKRSPTESILTTAMKCATTCGGNRIDHFCGE